MKGKLYTTPNKSLARALTTLVTHQPCLFEPAQAGTGGFIYSPPPSQMRMSARQNPHAAFHGNTASQKRRTTSITQLSCLFVLHTSAGGGDKRTAGARAGHTHVVAEDKRSNNKSITSRLNLRSANHGCRKRDNNRWGQPHEWAKSRPISLYFVCLW